jgi:hypothetical protein
MNLNPQQKKLVEQLAKINYKELAEVGPVFPKEVYEIYKQNGLTDQEIAQLEEAELLAQLVDHLPKDAKGIERLTGALAAVTSANPEINQRNLLLIAQKDPQMLVQLLALAEITEQTAE